MRILQIVHSLPSLTQAGTEIYAYNLSLELSKNHEVYIFSRACNLKDRDYSVTKEVSRGITTYLVNNTFLNCSSFQMLYDNCEIDRRFEDVLREVNPDIVHIHHLVFLSIGLIKKIKDKGIPIVFTLHDYWLICPRWHVLNKDSEPCEKFASGNFNEGCIDCLNELLNIKEGPKRIYNFVKKFLPKFMLLWLKKSYLLSANLNHNKNDNISELLKRRRLIKELLGYR